jgi:mannan endo-1,4-beta-mannosidase
MVLEAGDHRLRIGNGWGWFNVDKVTLHPVTALPPPKPAQPLSDRSASLPARQMMQWLSGLYGRKTLSGQHMGGAPELDRIMQAAGKAPALRSYDLMDYSPSRLEHGAHPGGTTEKALAWARSGGVLSLGWHWNAPTDLIDAGPDKYWYSGFYTRATTFDVAAALADSTSARYRLILRDIDAIAVELRKTSDAGMPVLWRPLHEASGRWFWWGAQGPAAFVKLWRLLYDRITRHHGLHNLIWVFTTYPHQGDWDPGEDVYDIVGYDGYKEGGSEAMVASGEWDALQTVYAGKKMLALAENGSIPHAGLMRALQVRWLWFDTWSGEFILQDRWNPPAAIRQAYQDPDVLSFEDVQAMPWKTLAQARERPGPGPTALQPAAERIVIRDGSGRRVAVVTAEALDDFGGPDASTALRTGLYFAETPRGIRRIVVLGP